MRPAKIPFEVVYQKVWASLCERMDPKTCLVRPVWKQMMREIGVCRQRIADVINELKANGKIEVVDEKMRKGDWEWIVTYYRVKKVEG